MQSDGAYYYTNFKMTDKTAAVYFNSNVKLNSENKFSVGARYHGNWLKASDSVNTRSILWGNPYR